MLKSVGDSSSLVARLFSIVVVRTNFTMARCKNEPRIWSVTRAIVGDAQHHLGLWARGDALSMGSTNPTSGNENPTIAIGQFPILTYMQSARR